MSEGPIADLVLLVVEYRFSARYTLASHPSAVKPGPYSETHDAHLLDPRLPRLPRARRFLRRLPGRPRRRLLGLGAHRAGDRTGCRPSGLRRPQTAERSVRPAR